MLKCSINYKFNADNHKINAVNYKINADNLHKDKDKQLPSILPKFFTPFFIYYHPFR